ncbi:MAG: hypothetical protein IAE98_03145 [Candidatus Kapabacteria bacterium]|nr:hypothetical protein [Candidatus Kapabacteria bacterium]
MKLPAINTPERIAFDFLSAWQRKDYEAMFKLCQSTWVKTTENAQQWLIDTFSQMDLKRFEIHHSYNATKNEAKKVTDAIASNMVYVHIKIRFIIEEKTINSEFSIVTIRESAPFTPDVNGTWGVNPISTYRGLAWENRKDFTPIEIPEQKQ